MNSQGKIAKNYQDEEIGNESDEHLIEILQTDAVFTKKIICVDILITRFLKSPEGRSFQKEFLQEIMPHIKDTLNSIFEKTVELSFDNQHERCLHTLEMIQQNLQTVIRLLDILDSLLVFIGSKNTTNLTNIQTISLYIGEILYTTFLHCKESNNIYLIYFDSINEIVLIFKKAQEVHTKLLRVLESHIIINVSNPQEILLLKTILDYLVDIGILLSGMNVKSMADNWKGYTSLTQKYNNTLAQDMDLKRPLKLLTNEILANLKGIFEMDDIKAITYTLKIASFLIKVMWKLCGTFWSNAKSNFDIFWDFLVNTYSYTVPSLKQLKYSPETLNLMNLNLIQPLDVIIQKFSIEENFYQLDEINIKPQILSYGYVLFINKLLQCCVNNLSEHTIDRYQLDKHLKNIISCLAKDQNLILQIDIYYIDLRINLPIIFSKLNNANFLLVEEVLAGHLLDCNIVIVLFVQDVWLSVVRLSGSSYAYSVLCNLVDKFTVLISSKFSNVLTISKLSNFLRNIFRCLNADYKKKFITKYPINKNIALWKLIGLDLVLISSKQDIELLLLDVIRGMDKLISRNCTLEQYFIMVDLLMVVSTIPFEETYLDVSKLSSLIIQLWKVEFNEELKESPFFDLLFKGLLKSTISLTWKLNSDQLLQISDTLKSTTKSNDVSRVLSLELFRNRMNKINQSGGIGQSENSFLSNLGEIAHDRLAVNNVVLKNETFQLIKQCFKTPLRDTFNQHLQKKTPTLKTKYSEFLKHYVNHSVVDLRNIDNCLSLQNCKYRHKCLEWSVEPKLKKIKSEENGEMTEILGKLKEDVGSLKRLLKREPLKNENVATISTIISDLHLCLK